ncbi:hypothetical protein PVAR5_0271 [Paecilomyces variotii No. 5]|uniref:Uncharacterized protein n=1 Tax=Byssochlamys spectabilis (strain No. 5 / NBRC 109023) TaxID=1356009 RepID=V5FSX5_BYSSN|nr:hypothetical protein PVAR5_0271 [Paecilomyces variotii No. 5]
MSRLLDRYSSTLSSTSDRLPLALPLDETICGKDSKGHETINRARAMRGRSKPRIVPVSFSGSSVLKLVEVLHATSAAPHRLVNVSMTAKRAWEALSMRLASTPFYLTSLQDIPTTNYYDYPTNDQLVLFHRPLFTEYGVLRKSMIIFTSPEA